MQVYLVTWFVNLYYQKPHEIVPANASICFSSCLLSWGHIKKHTLEVIAHLHGWPLCLYTGHDIQLLHCSYTSSCRLRLRRNFRVNCERTTWVDTWSFVLLEPELRALGERYSSQSCHCLITANLQFLLALAPFCLSRLVSRQQMHSSMSFKNC